jgi:hypothetical protein
MAGHDERFPDNRNTARTIRIKAHLLSKRLGAGVEVRREFEQDYWLEYLQARELFDPSRASWATFLEKVLESAGGHLMEKWNAKKRRIERQSRSLNAPLEDGSDETLEDVYGDVEHFELTGDGTPPTSETIDTAIDVRQVIASLSPELQKLAALLMRKSVAGIAADFGVPRTTLYGQVAKIRSAFERARLGPCDKKPRKSRQNRKSSGR